MLLCIVVGLMICWPLLRLSRQTQHHPIIHTLLDLSVLISLVQIILWPLRLITPWSSLRTASIDATICGWLLITGAIVASVAGSERRGPRNLAMFACVCLCLLGPALASIGIKYGFNDIELIGLSPLMAVHTLTDGGGSQPTALQWQWIGLLGIAALAVWSMLISFTMFQSRQSLAT